MSRPHGVLLAVLALCLGGVTACGVVTPPPSTARADRTADPAASRAPSTPASAPASAPTHPSDLGADLDIGTFERDLSGTTLEFISDGEAIVYSSSRAADAGPRGSPDLWRYEPGADEPVLLWRNPQRDNAIVKMAGEYGTVAFVDIPLTGERAWNLWLIPEPGAEAVLLDSHPGDEDVSSLVPSIAIYRPIVAWTAFDRGPAGPVSQLIVAEGPDWTPRVVQERRAAEAELWLPSLYGADMVYTEVRYSEDRSRDERFVHLLDLSNPGAEPRRLDASGRATMPLILDDVVLWKEAEPGFNMFNWGEMYRFDLATGEVRRISTWPQDAVNYPSIGERFAAWWGADSFSFGVYDVERDEPRLIERFPADSQDNVLRPHVAGSLLVWLFVDGAAAGGPSELRYAFLPTAGADRLDPP